MRKETNDLPICSPSENVGNFEGERERGGKHRMIVPYVRKRFSQTYGPMYLSLGRSYVAMHERLFRAI